MIKSLRSWLAWGADTVERTGILNAASHPRLAESISRGRADGGIDVTQLEERVLCSATPLMIDVPIPTPENAAGVHAPSLSSIADITIAEDTATPSLLFTITDADTPLSELIVSVHSSDTTLIPLENISIEGTGAERTILIRPADDRYGGPTAIEIHVSDGVHTTVEAFNVTVTPVNDAPTTTGFLDISVTEDSPATVIDLFSAFDDLEDADSQLTYSVTHNSNPGLFSSVLIDQQHGTLTLTYAANVSGTAELTLRATDSNGAYVERTTAGAGVPVYYRFIGTVGVDYPDFNAMGMKPLTYVSYFAMFDNVNGSYDFSHIDEAQLTWAMQQYFADVDPTVPVTFNIELPEYENTPTGRDNLAHVMNIANAVRPDLPLMGFYRLMPERNWWNPLNYDHLQKDLAAGVTSWYTNHATEFTDAYNSWLARNEEYRTVPLSDSVGGGVLGDRVGSIQPSLYTFYRSFNHRTNERSSVSFNGTTDTITSVAAFANGDAIRFHTTALPRGLEISNTYYVVNSTGTSFQLAFQPNGTAINFATGTYSGNSIYLELPFAEDPDTAAWDIYAEYNIAEARKFGKPVYSWLAPSFRGAGVEYLEEEFFLQQLRTSASLSDGIILWDPSIRTENLHASHGWYRALKTFLAENYSASTTFTVTVDTVNDPPVAHGIADVNVNEDAPNTVLNLSSMFSDADDPQGLTYTISTVTNPAIFSSVSFHQATKQLTLDYAPNAFGQSAITVRAIDPSGATATSTFHVNVQSVPDRPTATSIPDLNVVEGSTPRVVNLAPYFSDIDSLPAHRSYSITGNSAPSLFSSLNLNPVSGELVLEFAPEESGSANLTIRLTDEAGLTAESVLRVNVAAVNNPPVVSQLLQPLFVDEDANINTISLSQYFSDSDSVLAYRVAGISNPQLFSQVHVNSTTGSLSIALTPQASGRGEITLAAVDPAGLTATQILVVNVLPVNDPPTAVGWGTVLIAEDTTRSVNLRDGFRDGDDGSTALAFQILDNSAPLLFRSLTVNPDTGELLIRPAPNNSGPATLTIRATDPHGSYVDEALTIVVQPVNDSPVSLDAPDVVVPRGTTSSVVQLANYYHDDDDPLLEYRVISNSNSPLFSKVVLGKASGQLTLTYADNAYGFADLRIRVTDPAGAYVEETIRVRVLGSPHPVDGIPDIEVFEDAAPTEINLPSVFLDLEDKTQPVSFSVTSITNAQLFTSVLVDPGNGTLRVSYAPNASGEADITVTATDSSGATSSDTFRVRIKPVNDHPTATAIPTVTVTEDAPATVIKLAEFFSDIEDSLLSYTIRSVGDADILGSAYVEDGTTNLVIIPRANAFGSTVLTVQAADSQGATVTETVHVEVVSVNDTPQPAKVSVLHLMQRPAPITINLRDLFRDADHPVTALSFRVKDVINAPLIQTKTIDQANGTLTLIVSPTRFGFAEIVIEATDPQSGKGDARLMVFVEQDNSDNGQIVDDVSAGPSTDTATVELRSAFSSIDNGGTLRYTLLSNSQPSLFRSVSFYNSTGKLILDFKNTADGQATLTVLATNQQGDTAVVAFSVTARPTSAAPPDIGSGLPRDGTLGDANPDINSPSSTPPTDNATADRQRALLEFVESHSDERPSNTVTIVPTSTTVGQTDRPGLRSNVHPDDDHDEYESSMAALLQQIAPEANPYTTILSEMTSSRQTVTRGDSLTSEDAMGPSLSVLATSASTSDGRRHLSESIAPTEVTPDPYLEAATSSSLPSQSTPDIDSAQPQPANSPSPAPLMPAPPPTGSAESSGPTSADDRAVGDRDPAPDVA